MIQVLDGIRVLDLTQGMAGSIATMTLSDFGADVIKIEPPGGDPYRSFSSSLLWNRGKSSVVIDLKNENGASEFLKLVASADVVVESFRPGYLESLGLGYDGLKLKHPRLIFCSITGFGQKGP